MDFTEIVNDIIRRYMPELDEEGYNDPRDIVSRGLTEDLQYAYNCGINKGKQLSIDIPKPSELNEKDKQTMKYLDKIIKSAVESPGWGNIEKHR